jgi:membrane protein DedA with SNARE-associated domain
LAQAFGIFGLPIPDELLLTIAGVLIAKGLLPAPTAVAATIAGCLTGISLSYALGRLIGLPILRARFRRHERGFNRVQAWSRRLGVWLLAFGYFIPGVRHISAIMAASAGVGYARFAIFAYPGGVLWCGVFLLLGYYAGEHWRETALTAKSILAFGAIAAVGAGAVYVLFRIKATRTIS